METNEVYSDLGSNHKMWTKARLNTATGLLEANTRTATFTWFGGYRGGVQVVLLDPSDFIVYTTQPQKFGVDGTLVGRNDRTETWSESIPLDIVAKTSSLQVFHFWADDAAANLNRVLSVGISIVDAVAKVVALFGNKSGTGK